MRKKYGKKKLDSYIVKFSRDKNYEDERPIKGIPANCVINHIYRYGECVCVYIHVQFLMWIHYSILLNRLFIIN